MDDNNNTNNNNNNLSSLSIETADNSKYDNNLSPGRPQLNRDKSMSSIDSKEADFKETELVEIYKVLTPKQRDILLHKIKSEPLLFSDKPRYLSKV